MPDTRAADEARNGPWMRNEAGLLLTGCARTHLAGTVATTRRLKNANSHLHLPHETPAAGIGSVF